MQQCFPTRRSALPPVLAGGNSHANDPTYINSTAPRPPTIAISHFSQDPDCSKTDIFEVSHHYRHSAAVGVKPPLPRERWIQSRFVKCIGRRSEKGPYFPRYPGLLRRRPLNNPSLCLLVVVFIGRLFTLLVRFFYHKLGDISNLRPGERESERRERESPNQSLLLGIGLNLHTTADRGGRELSFLVKETRFG